MTKIIVLGASGLVGSRFIELKKDTFELLTPESSSLDILDSEQLKRYISQNTPSVVINFAAFTNVAEAETESGNKEGRVYGINSLAVQNLAKICLVENIHLIQISTEYVFDGKKIDSPYLETDSTNPINWYGQTKLFAEEFIQEIGGKYTIARISMPYRKYFDPKKDLVRTFLSRLQEGLPIQAITDTHITPVFVDELCLALEKIVTSGLSGIIHLVPNESITPFEFVNLIADTFSLPKELVSQISFAEYSKGKEKLLLKDSWLSGQKYQEFDKSTFRSIPQSIQAFNQKEAVDSREESR